MAKNSTPPSSTPAPMTASAAARIQSVTARANGGKVPSGSFAARAQTAAAAPFWRQEVTAALTRQLLSLD